MSDEPLHSTSDAEVGLYTWDLSADLVYADGALAVAFGLDPRLTQSGLPILTFIDRIHPEDRPRVAQGIHRSIRAAGPFQSEYRVMNANGMYTSVVAYGRCFSDREGSPTLYAGIVHPSGTLGFDPQAKLLDLMLDALSIASAADLTSVTEDLRSIIYRLSTANIRH